MVWREGERFLMRKEQEIPEARTICRYIYFLPLLVHITLGVGKCLQYYLRTKIYILYTCTSKLLHVPATKSLKRSKRRSKWKVDLFINISQYKIIVHNVQSIIRTAQYLFFSFWSRQLWSKHQFSNTQLRKTKILRTFIN